MRYQPIRALIIAAVLGFTLPAQAALFDRGGGLIYDDVLNITWLQDANYAKTSGYDTDGRMDWGSANAWAAGLTYGGYSDWRLASNTPVGADWNYGFSYDGTTDYGYNITSTHSELAYMYYVNLGLDGYYSPSGVFQPTWGIFGNGTLDGTNANLFGEGDVGLIYNLQAYAYWSGTANAPTVGIFYTGSGFQDVLYGQNGGFYAWAVRPGDVAAVPEPESYALLLAGLGLVGWAARRRG